MVYDNELNSLMKMQEYDTFLKDNNTFSPLMDSMANQTDTNLISEDFIEKNKKKVEEIRFGNLQDLRFTKSGGHDVSISAF